MLGSVSRRAGLREDLTPPLHGINKKTKAQRWEVFPRDTGLASGRARPGPHLVTPYSHAYPYLPVLPSPPLCLCLVLLMVAVGSSDIPVTCL